MTQTIPAFRALIPIAFAFYSTSLLRELKTLGTELWGDRIGKGIHTVLAIISYWILFLSVLRVFEINIVWTW